MRILHRSLAVWLAMVALMGITAAACSTTPVANAPGTNGQATAGKTAVAAEKGGQEEFGPYELVSNWPQPLADGPDGVKHEGWTWGSVGAVYAETPDRIWIAQRGELPLPSGAKPWTP